MLLGFFSSPSVGCEYYLLVLLTHYGCSSGVDEIDSSGYNESMDSPRWVMRLAQILDPDATLC